MRKLMTVILIAALLAGSCAAAEGILPMLQTPAPQITEAVSYHYFGNESTPTAGLKDGSYYYYYTPVRYDRYLLFGQALAQEGYTLAGTELAEDGTGAVTATVEKAGAATLTICYNEDKRELTVYYPPSVEAMDMDEENPYVIDGTQTSVLPELKQMISLHAVTWASRPTGDNVKLLSEGGYQYFYYNIPYDAYRRFSIKLGEAGFTLVSSGKTEDGLDVAVVTDGEDEMTIAYDQERKRAYVSYPPFAHARDRIMPDDYDIIRNGEPFSLGDNITATITGWEPVEKFYSRENGKTLSSGDGCQWVIVLMDVDYRRPTGIEYRYLVDFGKLYAGEDDYVYTFGEVYNSDPSYYIDSIYKEIAGKMKMQTAIVLKLSEEMAANPSGVAVTFSGAGNYEPYVYYLQPPEAE